MSKAIALIQNNCSRTKCKIKDYSPSRASGCKKQVELNGRHKIFSKSSSQLDKIKILHFIEYDEQLNLKRFCIKNKLYKQKL